LPKKQGFQSYVTTINFSDLPGPTMQIGEEGTPAPAMLSTLTFKSSGKGYLLKTENVPHIFS
jgi:hypothetical protein